MLGGNINVILLFLRICHSTWEYVSSTQVTSILNLNMDCGFCAKPLQKLGTRELLLVFRRAMLEEHRLLLVFLSDYEDLVCWLRDLLQRLKSEDLPRNLKATEEAIRVHDERKVLWDTCRLRNSPFRSWSKISNVDNASWDSFGGRAFCLRPLKQSHGALSTSLLPGI